MPRRPIASLGTALAARPPSPGPAAGAGGPPASANVGALLTRIADVVALLTRIAVALERANEQQALALRGSLLTIKLSSRELDPDSGLAQRIQTLVAALERDLERITGGAGTEGPTP